MLRKVNRVGTGTLTVSLPSEWIKKYDVKTGDELNISFFGSRLIIDRNNTYYLGEMELNIPSADTFKPRMLIRPYILGYKEIKINFEEIEVIEALQNASQYLLGFEIVHQGKKNCILKNIAHGAESEFEGIFNRMMLNVMLIAEEFCSSLKNGDRPALENLKPIFRSVDRLSIFSKRMLTLKGTHDNVRSSHALYSIINLFKTISYSYERLISYVLQNNPKFDNSVLKHAEAITEITKKCYSLTKNFSYVHYNNLIRTNEALIKDCETLLKNNQKHLIFISYILYLHLAINDLGLDF